MHLTQIVRTVAILIAQSSHAFGQAYYNQPLPLPCSGPACVEPYGTNTSSLQFQDTSVIQANGQWYRFSKGNNTGLGLNVVTAPTLGGPWNYAYQILNGPLKSSCGAADGQATSWRWAPEIHLVNGTYYLFYTVEHPDGGKTCFDQCVATSTTLGQNSWVDRGSLNIPTPSPVKSLNGPTVVPYVRLDGNLLAASSNPQGVVYPPYMVFGSYQFGLYGIQLTDDLLSAQPGAVPKLIIADQYQTPVPGTSNTYGNYSEGAYQLINGNYIYLFYSRGDCCAGGDAPVGSVYQVQVCRTPVGNGPTGPYVDRSGQDCSTGGSAGWNRTGSIFLYTNNNNGNLASVFAPGSVGVTHDTNGRLVMWYQYQNNTSNSKNLGFGYNYLSFGSDGWPILTAQ